jgi:hypothetical protein
LSLAQACATTTKEEKKRGCSKRGPTTFFTARGIDHQPDEEKYLLDGGFLFKHEASEGGFLLRHSSALAAISVLSTGWRMFSSGDEEQASPYYHEYDSLASEKGRDVSPLLRGQQKQP